MATRTTVIHFFIHLTDPEGPLAASSCDLSQANPDLVRVESREVEVTLPDDLQARLRRSVEHQLASLDLHLRSQHDNQRRFLERRLADLKQETSDDPQVA